ncbi:hypothetical protein Mhun_1535 [Methanospirillum hungatei JF-1]|uniref:Uncharacterized protein n=2 Tax=Methanospirillum hungatei TaxID=2203 RepID=Q2FNV8_METHJ|nr:hypothetical protein Mhun_1535 [Methanospirillum hungatei JF-1]
MRYRYSIYISMLIPIRIGQIFSPKPYEYQMIIMRRYWIFPSVVILILIISLLILPVYGASPSYDPVTGRDYDTFGGFFDQYGQYVDPMGGVMDQYGEYVPDSYSEACDTYSDSQGQVYGGKALNGSMKEGDWLFGNTDKYRIDWPPYIELTRNSDCNLQGSYINAAGVPFTITIREKRRYLGTTVDQIALNLKDIADPSTQEKLFKEAGRETELARMMLQSKVIDDNGYIHLIRGEISNPDENRCKSWNVGFTGYSFDNGRRFRASYWSCYVCNAFDGSLEEGEYHCHLLYSDPMSEDNTGTQWPWASMAEEDIDGDWLGDGQQIDDPGPVKTNAPMHGVNPLGSASFDVPIKLE